MSLPDYYQSLVELLQGEIIGEALFSALCSVAKQPSQHHQFATLLQLETETKARLRPLLYKYRLGVKEHFSQATVDATVQQYLTNDWQAFLVMLRAWVYPFLTRLRSIEQIAPMEDREVMRHVLAHEEAIVDWLDQEIAGESKHSLDAVIGLLQFPLPEQR